LGTVIAVFITTASVVILQRRENMQAKKEIEELKSANLALEGEIQPRRLSQSQIIEIGSALSKFAGRKVKVSSHSTDVESAILGAHIILAFQ